MKETALETIKERTIDFTAMKDREVVLCGMIQNIRVLSWGAFLILRTPEYTIQTILDNSTINIPPDRIPVESAVRIRGIVRDAKIKDTALWPRDAEIHATEITLISTPAVSSLPVDTTKKELNVHLDKKFDYRPLTLRHPRERAVFRVAAAICNEFGDYLASIGFTRICSPKIVYSGAEGGANIFGLDYFGREAYLTQSPQFYKQMMVGVYGRVFETGPVFRAEKHDTSRHLNEYISLDFEMGFIDGFMDLIRVEAHALNAIFGRLERDCGNEIELLGIRLPKIERIVTVEFDEVHEIVLKESGKDYRSEPDLAPEEEKLLSEYAVREWNTEFVFVTRYPSSKRPFYTMDDPDDPEKTCSFDLVFRNMEITTGGQRLHRYEDYEAKMKRLGMNVDMFGSYLQAFRFGMPPHGGLGLGLERLTAQLCGLSNIKEASLFPRDINRLEP
ncbi:MAG: aspartate--tRNA(Asn) ligase [Spirochaetales bacterium]|nr:aspartate--tRNA(Asn) ligase [Spirochaetales bacterium]